MTPMRNGIDSLILIYSFILSDLNDSLMFVTLNVKNLHIVHHAPRPVQALLSSLFSFRAVFICISLATPL